MGRRVLNRFLERFGYRISKLAPEPDTSRGYALYTYLTKDGVFDYGQYRHIQREGNKRKLNLVWVCEENIDFLSRYIQERRNSSVWHLSWHATWHGTGLVRRTSPL